MSATAKQQKISRLPADGDPTADISTADRLPTTDSNSAEPARSLTTATPETAEARAEIPTFSPSDRHFMRMALEEAAAAESSGDVPVGAVLVETQTGRVIGKGHNTREAFARITGHAELNAMQEGAASLGGWRLSGCTLYVTLEPCPMCGGAILQSRVERVVYGASDPVAGAMGSVWSLHRHPVESRHTRVEGGCLEEECRELLQAFFASKRGRAPQGK